MRRTPFKTLLLVVGAAVIWGILLISAHENYVTVVKVERNMSKSGSSLQNHDCLITAKTDNNKRMSGYGPSSYCTSLKAGDKIIIENGSVTRK